MPRRGLSRQEAARYIGTSTTKFDELVRESQMPKPFRIGSRTIWDLRKLDAAFDLLSGPEEEFDSFADWDALPEKAQTRPSPTPAREDAKRKALARSIPSEEYPGHPHVYTADTLAAHWMCSADLVRKLVQRGELIALMSGPRMLWISPAAVIAYEQANAVAPKNDEGKSYLTRANPQKPCWKGDLPARAPEAFATPHGSQRVSMRRQADRSQFLPSYP